MVKDTRQRIVEAAMELFWLKGYGSTSIADILSRSQVNSGSLYHFFPGKQDLLLAVLEAYRDGIGPMLLEPAWSGVDDPIERVFALLGSLPPRARSRPTAPTAARSAASRSNCTRPTRSCASGWPRISPAGSRRSKGCFDAAADRFPAGTDTRGARRNGPQRHGGRSHAGAHLSRRRILRPRRRAAAAACRRADREGSRSMIRWRSPRLPAGAAPAHRRGWPAGQRAVRSEPDGTSACPRGRRCRAAPEQVWDAISTVAGWTSGRCRWRGSQPGEPDVIETSYDPAARPGDAINIESMDHRSGARSGCCVFRTIKAPEGFPDFEAHWPRSPRRSSSSPPATARTRVWLTGTGLPATARRAGACWLSSRAAIRSSLEMLRDRFASGPIDWTEKLKKPGNKGD